MKILMARWILQITCGIVLLGATACDVKFESRGETDAELFCRQSGFDIGSTAYDECVATGGPIKRRMIKQ